jgi:tetratricopeptide (TPR) repeat protein
MYSQDESTTFNEFLAQFSRTETFSKIIVSFQSREYLETFQQLSNICEDKEQYSSEEKWLAHYIRRIVGKELLNSSTSEDDRRKYREYIIQDRMLLKYHSIFFAGYKEEVIYHPSSSSNAASEQDLPQNDAPNDAVTLNEAAYPSKSKIKRDKKKQRIANLVVSGDEFFEQKNYKNASIAYQRAIDLGLKNGEVHTKCIGAYVAINDNNNVILLGTTIIQGLEMLEESDDTNDTLYITHLYLANSYLARYNDLTDLQNAYKHYTVAHAFPGPEPIPGMTNKSLADVTYKLMRHYRFKTDRTTVNKEKTLEYAMESYSKLKETIDGEMANKATPEDLLEYYIKLSEVAHFVGKHDESTFYFKKVIAIDPSLLQAYKHLAIVYCSCHDFTSAIDNLNEVLLKIRKLNEFSPENKLLVSEVYFYLGVCHIYLGQKIEATNAFVESTKLSGLNKGSVLALVQLESLAVSKIFSDDTSKYDGIIADINRALSEENEPFVHSYFLGIQGFIQIKHKKLSEAVDTYAKAAEYFPLTPMNQSYYEKAKLLLKAKTNPSALTELFLLRAPKQTNSQSAMEVTNTDMKNNLS